MHLVRKILEQVLWIAEKKGDSGIMRKDICSLFQGSEESLTFHLDYLTYKGFMRGEFTPGEYAAYALLPKPIYFVQGCITTKGRDYLAGLQKQQQEYTRYGTELFDSSQTRTDERRE